MTEQYLHPASTLCPPARWPEGLLSRLYRAAALLLSTGRQRPAPLAVDRQAADRQAERLLSHYGNSILRLVYAYLHNMSDAEEVLQDALIQYLRVAPAFDSPEHEKAWLLRVAANLSKNRIGYNKIRATDQLEESLAAEEREDLSFVWQAVKALPTPYREAIHLFYHEGCSTAEIARVLARKESTVRSDLRRGRERLKEILKEGYGFEEGV